ncbi:hypothetical protein HKH47_002292 [Enterococcus faecalis]|nr:hypothetical protein [Enterococcus faecalis]
MFDKINEWQERIETFREQVQSKEKKPRKIQSKLQKHASKFYILMCVFTICGYLFFSFSRSIFKDDSPMLDTGIGVASKTKIGSSEVEILSRKVNEDSGYGEVLFSIEDGNDQVHKNYVAFAGESKSKQQIKNDLQEISTGYYLLKLNGIPKEWKEIIIDFGYNEEKKAPTSIEQIEEETEEKQKNQSQQTTFYWDVRKSKNSPDLKEKPKENYELEVIKIEEKEVGKQQKILAENSKKIDEEIKLIEEKIATEKQELFYKVGEEKEDGEEIVRGLEREKETYLETKKKIAEEQELLEEKADKLAEKRNKITTN